MQQTSLSRGISIDDWCALARDGAATPVTIPLDGNIMLPLIYAHVPAKERRERAMIMLSRVGLEDKAQNKPLQLSGGQMQRVAIARAMVTDPSIILADEPTGALDQKTGEQIMELFSRLNEEGKTIVMITHSLKTSSYASRVVHMVDGRLHPDDGSGNAADVL